MRDELVAAGEAIAAPFDPIPDDPWAAGGAPGNGTVGTVFTVRPLGRDFLHDLEHHVHDVRPNEGEQGTRQG